MAEPIDAGSTVEALPALREDEIGLVLTIVEEHGARRRVLPEGGQLRIGRQDDNDVTLSDPLVSRYHAVLHCGDALEVEDLGGANGTRVRGEAVPAGERRPVAPGQVVEVGSTLLVVQRPKSAPSRVRLMPHGYFELRLEEACLAPGDVTVVWIHAGEATPAAVEAALGRALMVGDLVGRYAEGRYELLLFGGDPDRLRAELPAGATAGVARRGPDGQEPQALWEAARARAGEARVEADDGPPVVREPVMEDLFALAARVARGRVCVLILGETGVGKEILAHAVHARSPRSDGPFVTLNCGALSESLLESELFGHEKGAFTGADRDKAGLIESAERGTLFLDEVGELSPSLQVKLLRVLETGEVQRVGAVSPRRVDVRFVAATHRDLEGEARAGRFREDLFFRLSGVTLAVPPLRERPSEVEPLARRFAAQAAREAGDPEPEVTAEALAVLATYDWPGNLRELRNVMTRATLLSAGAPIRAEHLPLEKLASRPLAESPDVYADAPPEPPGLSGLERADRARLIEALRAHAGNQTRAARALGFSRQTLSKKLDRYGLPRPRK